MHQGDLSSIFYSAFQGSNQGIKLRTQIALAEVIGFKDGRYLTPK